MLPTRIRLVTVSAMILLSSAGLVGCVQVVEDPHASVTPTAPAPPQTDAAGAADCGGREIDISASSEVFALRGDCPVVHIGGNDLAVQLSGAKVGTVSVNGDRNAISSAAMTSLTIAGQDNVVHAPSIGSLQINGDRNTVTASDTLGAVFVSGNDNTVSGTTLGTTSDHGDRNTLRARANG